MVEVHEDLREIGKVSMPPPPFPPHSICNMTRYYARAFRVQGVCCLARILSIRRGRSRGLLRDYWGCAVEVMILQTMGYTCVTHLL